MSNPYPYVGTNYSAAFSWIANASNVKTQSNPTYTSTMFLADFPQFTGLTPDPIPSGVLDQFITVANSTVLEARWHESWRLGMGYFIAHFATLFTEAAAAGPTSTASQVVTAAQGEGLITSKAVGDVSVSYDNSSLTAALQGWGMFNATSYGRQFATMARLLGKAGMYIY